ncbi:MAG: NifB/NifX family molybdenum-iron cluster-binding protein [Bryobacteraceae bacterium]|nr:NifB/NifX family molybdenum-iron cluster-binding protein [Bryobacteraceae bacterium]
MRIAIPTDDGVSVAAHFGRSAAFLVFSIEDGRILSQETRPNAGQHSGAPGECESGAHSGAGHDHGAIVASIAGCDVVICAGMGSRAAEALKSSGVSEILMTQPGPAVDIVNSYLAGTLASRAAGFCCCSH